jgi:hypothetical protein
MQLQRNFVACRVALVLVVLKRRRAAIAMRRLYNEMFHNQFYSCNVREAFRSSMVLLKPYDSPAYNAKYPRLILLATALSTSTVAMKIEWASNVSICS